MYVLGEAVGDRLLPYSLLGSYKYIYIILAKSVERVSRASLPWVRLYCGYAFCVSAGLSVLTDSILIA